MAYYMKMLFCVTPAANLKFSKKDAFLVFPNLCKSIEENNCYF